MSIKTAIILLSGGLDSALAAKLMLTQNINLIGLKFTSPFCTCNQGGICYSKKISDDLNIKYMTIKKGIDYLNIIRNPKFGYGKGLNPCIDCRIYMLKRTKKYMKKINADFIVTGEVVGQRPMSQYKQALKIIEHNAGLDGKIVRPLSAKILPITVPEQEGIINRKKMLNLTGRSRKPQLKLAQQMNIDTFACAAGGCLLTQKSYSLKLKDLFESKKNVKWNDIRLLKIGRHFRFGNNKIIVGRNKHENKLLEHLKNKYDYKFDMVDYNSPITLLQGRKTKQSISFAATITARYSDCKVNTKVSVVYGTDNFNNEITVKPMPIEKCSEYNIAI